MLFGAPISSFVKPPDRPCSSKLVLIGEVSVEPVKEAGYFSIREKLCCGATRRPTNSTHIPSNIKKQKTIITYNNKTIM